MAQIERDGESRELRLTAVHPEVELDDVQAATAWELRGADDVAETQPHTDAELKALRGLGGAA
jgi:glutaconate CoA-transferase, subunit B